MGDMFGGGGGGIDVSNLDLLLPKQKRALNKVLREILPQIGEGIPMYEGLYTPGPSELQEMQWGFLEDIMGGHEPYTEMARGSLEEMLGEYDPTAGREYWETAIQAPAMEMWESDILPNVLEPFAGAGALDSAAARRQAARAGTELTTGLEANLADILFGERQAHEQRKQWATEQAGQIPMLQAQLLGMAGGEQRNIAAQKGLEQLQKWQMGQPWANPWLQYLFPALGVKAIEPMVQYPTEGTGAGMSQMISAMMSAAIMALMLI